MRAPPTATPCHLLFSLLLLVLFSSITSAAPTTTTTTTTKIDKTGFKWYRCSRNSCNRPAFNIGVPPKAWGICGINTVLKMYPNDTKRKREDVSKQLRSKHRWNLPDSRRWDFRDCCVANEMVACIGDSDKSLGLEYEPDDDGEMLVKSWWRDHWTRPGPEEKL